MTKEKFLSYFLKTTSTSNNLSGNKTLKLLGFSVLYIFTQNVGSIFFFLFRFQVLCRQTPPVGHPENLTRPPFLLQRSSGTKPGIYR